MKDLFEKFESIKQESKKTEKVTLLEKYKDDALFLFVLEFLVNTHKVTGISNSKLNRELEDIEPDEIELNDIKDLINYLLANPTGRNKIIRTAQLFVESQDEQYREFINGLITKSYKCGLTVKTVSSVLPELIKNDHQIMLANKFKGDIKEPVQVSLKLDGVRCTILINYDGSITFLSRQGKEIKGLKQIQSALKNKMLEGYVLDGELIKINVDNKPSEENFKETTSIVNSKESNKEGLEFVAFDIIPLNDYFKHECDLTYKQRFDLLVGKIGIGDGFIRIVPIYGVTDSIDVVYEKLNEVTSANQEGLMLNTLTGLYKFGKRSNDLLKVKKFDTCDLLCIGIEEGEGKYAGTLGKIVCDYKGYELRVGSGLTDEEREQFWNDPDLIINKIVEIKYFEESKDDKGNLSLRFPTWVGLRLDKNEPSYE